VSLRVYSGRGRAGMRYDGVGVFGAASGSGHGEPASPVARMAVVGAVIAAGLSLGAAVASSTRGGDAVARGAVTAARTTTQRAQTAPAPSVAKATGRVTTRHGRKPHATSTPAPVPAVWKLGASGHSTSHGRGHHPHGEHHPKDRPKPPPHHEHHADRPKHEKPHGDKPKHGDKHGRHEH
jgi:hypothetical protein